MSDDRSEGDDVACVECENEYTLDRGPIEFADAEFWYDTTELAIYIHDDGRVVCDACVPDDAFEAFANTTDYTFPEDWGTRSPAEKDFWYKQERTYRRAMKQDTQWGELARAYHSDSEFKVEDDLE